MNVVKTQGVTLLKQLLAGRWPLGFSKCFWSAAHQNSKQGIKGTLRVSLHGTWVSKLMMQQ